MYLPTPGAWRTKRGLSALSSRSFQHERVLQALGSFPGPPGFRVRTSGARQRRR
jgi:hypothetical protein